MLKSIVSRSATLTAHTKRVPLTLCTHQIFKKPFQRFYSLHKKIDEDFPQQTVKINVATKQPQTEEEKYSVYISTYFNFLSFS